MLSSDWRGLQRLASGISGILFVPELDFALAQPPAQQHAPAPDFAREIDETHASVFEKDAELLELALIAIDLARERLGIALELLRAFARFIGTRRRRDEIELEDLFAPQPVLAHDVLDDPTNEWKR